MRITADEMMLAMTGVSEQLITESLSESKTLRERALTHALTAAASLLLVVGIAVFAAATGWHNHAGSSPVGGSGTENEGESEKSDTAQETEYGGQNGADAENQSSRELIKKYFLYLERQDAEGLYGLMVNVTRIGSRYTRMISDKENRDMLDGIYNYKTASISGMKMTDVREDRTDFTWIDDSMIYDLRDKGERMEVWTVEANVETYRPSRFIKEGNTAYVFFILVSEDDSRSIVWVRGAKDGDDIETVALDDVPTRSDRLSENITVGGRTVPVTTEFDGVGIVNIEVGGEGFEVTRVSGTDKFCIESGDEVVLYDAAAGGAVDLKNDVPERDVMEKLGIEVEISPTGALICSNDSRYIYYYSFKEERYINLASKFGVGEDEAAYVRLSDTDRVVLAEIYRPDGKTAHSGEFVGAYELNLVTGELQRTKTKIYGSSVRYRRIEVNDGTEYSVIWRTTNGKIAAHEVIWSQTPVKSSVYNGNEIVMASGEFMDGCICAFLPEETDEDAAVEVIEYMGGNANGVWAKFESMPKDLIEYLEAQTIGGENNISVNKLCFLYVGDCLVGISDLYGDSANAMDPGYRPENIDGVTFEYENGREGILIMWMRNANDVYRDGEVSYRVEKLADAYASGNITKEELTWIGRVWSYRDVDLIE